jgi:hypothetical protein
MLTANLGTWDHRLDEIAPHPMAVMIGPCTPVRQPAA